MIKNLIEKLLEVHNDGDGEIFNETYDVKNYLFKKMLIAKKYGFYDKIVSLFVNDCKKLKERLGDNWYKNELARYMLYRKYNVKELRAKCDNFPISECDSSMYAEKFIYKIDEAKEKMKSEPWLTIEKNNQTLFFADTLTPPWTILRSLIEYCYMVDRNDIFEEDTYEDLKGHKVFNFKIPDSEINEINKRVFEEIGINCYEVSLLEYIIENIVTITEVFTKHLGNIELINEFLSIAHNGSGSNYIVVPRELLNRSRDPYINRKVAPNIELPNAGRLWDFSDILLIFIHNWYAKNYNKEINVYKYIENQDVDLKYLAKLKKENKEIKNIKLWLNFYLENGGYDNFIEEYKLVDLVYKKDDEINILLEELSGYDKKYSEKYGFPIELFKGHLYKYDLKEKESRDLPYGIYKGDSLEEDFPIPGYVNGINDFIELFSNFKKYNEKRAACL